MDQSLRRAARAAVAVTLALAVGAAQAGADASRPNVVLMLSDNLGYGEIGVYGGGVLRGAPTPRLDALAAEGLRFTNFNVELECTPSRSALMTGRLPVRSGTWRAAVPGLPGGLAPWEVTLAESLSDAGYETAIFGKWHLGDSEGRYPTDQGFDEWWGFPFSTNIATYRDKPGYDPSRFPDPKLLEARRGETPRPVEPYTTRNRPLVDERIARRATDWIRARAGSERPFFLFVAWSLVHHPYLPHPEFAGRSGNGPFADVMVEHDHRVGQVLDALDAADLADDTIVLYLSDNGPDSAHHPQGSFAGPFRGWLGSAFEGSVRTPMIVRWPGHVPAGAATNEIVSIVDLFPTLAGLAGAKVPDDRAVDGVDQAALLLGRSPTSARESALFFSGRTLLAVKWRRFKVFLVGDDPSPRDRAWRRLWAPLVYNVEQDPREENDIAMDNLWVLSAALRPVYELLFSLDDEGLILPGGDEPEPGTVEIPFQSQEEIEKSMSAIRWRFLKERVREWFGHGD
jgi:arylsulfatase